MANRYPLVVNTSTGRIAELPAGDNLDLSQSGISNVGDINVTGEVVATGNITGDFFIGNGSQLTGITTSPAGTSGQLQYNNGGAFAGVPGVTYTSGNLNLGAVANVKVTGGSSGQALVTDGSGNLSFSSIQADSFMLRPVRAATTDGITLSGTQTIDGVALSAGDRVLVWRQATQSQNGIYVVQAGAWTRATDFDTGAQTLQGGVTVTVTAGTWLAGVTFYCTNTTAITIGSTAIAFERSQNTGFISIWTAAGSFQTKAVGSTSSGATTVGVSASSSTDAAAFGYSAVAGSSGVSFGYAATSGTAGTSLGRSSTSGQDATAIGNGASATGAGSVAVGRGSSATNTSSVGLGRNTVVGGLQSIAIGESARASSANSISIGAFTGVTNQAANTIAVGRSAGNFSQGANSIAIGHLAGVQSQASSSIILNATGSQLDNTVENSFVVKPIRNASGSSALYYDATSGEITYSSIPSATPAGANTQIQFNNAGSLGASANLTFNNATNTLSATNIVGTTMTVDGLEVGTKIVPQVSQSANYTLVASDSGKHILHPSADTTARTFTIPANSSVAYPIGTTITFVNQNGAGNVTIAITSDTMRLAGAGTTGSRTLAANGVATAIKIATTEWIISGVGLT